MKPSRHPVCNLLRSFLLLSTSCLSASLELRPFTPIPTDRDLNGWIEHHYSHGNFFVGYEAELRKVIESAPLSSTIRRKILSRMQAWRPWENEKKVYLALPREIMDEMPGEIITQLWERQLQDHNQAPPVTLEFESTLAFEKSLDAHSITPETREILKRQLIHGQGRTLLPVWPANWAMLPPTLQREALATDLKPSNLNTGVRVDLVIDSSDDLEDLAKRFSITDEDRVKNYKLLSAALGAQQEARVNLESILPEHLRESIGTYSPCDGPNCLYTAMGIESKSPPKEMKSSTFGHLLDQRFVLRPPGEKTQFNDVIVYLDADGKIVHSARNIADGLYLTKHGFDRRNPNLLASEKQMQNIWGDLTTKVYAWNPIDSARRPCGFFGRLKAK
jgi:hypothetical protein